MAEFQFAKRLDALFPPEYRRERNTLKTPGSISFAADCPPSEFFPEEELRDIAEELLSGGLKGVLQPGEPEGYAPLREKIVERCRKVYRTGRESDRCLLFSDRRQGLDLLARTLLGEGDIVLVEAPCSREALDVFRMCRARLIGVPVDERGMNTEALARILDVYPEAKLIVTAPDFQNPTGATLPLSRRKELLELSARYGVYILEDSPRRDLRLSGEALPTLKSLDGEGRVIFLGDYSPLFSAGFGAAYAILHSEIAEKLLLCKQTAGAFGNPFSELLLSGFLDRCDLEAHIARCAEICRGKLDRMISALERHLAGKMEWRRPEGGLFLWVTLPEGHDSREICCPPLSELVAISPGFHFFINPGIRQSGMRLNFAAPVAEEIDSGISALAAALSRL